MPTPRLFNCLTKWMCVWCAVVALGCNRAVESPQQVVDTPQPASIPSVPRAGTSQPAHSDSAKAPEPSDEVVGNLSRFAGFELILPERFEFTETPAGVLPPNIQVGIWRAMRDPQTPEAIFIITEVADAKAAQEGRDDMPQSLVNSLAGTAKQMGIKLAGRGKTETAAPHGIDLTHFSWGGVSANGQEVGGTIYGTLTPDDRFISLLHIAYGGDPKSILTEMKRHMTTLRVASTAP